MNEFDGKSYFIDNPIEFQRTSIAGPNGTSFPRASITFHDIRVQSQNNQLPNH
jgi:hypothetical protein